MNANRLLTTAVQLVLLGVTIPLLIAVIKDIKENGLQSACRFDKIESCPHLLWAICTVMSEFKKLLKM